jgi:hypothetical protein
MAAQSDDSCLPAEDKRQRPGTTVQNFSGDGAHRRQIITGLAARKILAIFSVS